ncbi:hypothetical protein HY256_00945, partial [Candidatus Sumerlaeota bacterium]|nr:hypothetical protein [Candidatus Sumerlaeota bacterium]
MWQMKQPMAFSEPKPNSSNARYLRRRMFGAALAVLIVGSMAGMVFLSELYAGRLIAKNPQFLKGREILRGDTLVAGSPELERKFSVIGYPYLLYICAPNNAERGHNRYGFRGPEVAVKRSPGIARILFLGGSTTYGPAVAADQTYPAQVQSLLKEQLGSKYTDIEVINGGLPFGTTAELLTHYHFKYHYYRPDIVVINAGGNDAQLCPGPF